MNQEPQTLELANDCLRFVTEFFEVISISAPHIYHSALILCPKESMVQKLYGPQAKPLARVIQGVPTSWDPSIANRKFSCYIAAAAWSPCSRFIAAALSILSEIVVLDAVTLEQLHTMYSPQEETHWTHVIFSPDGHLLTGCSYDKDYIVSWDLQTGCLLSSINTKARCSSVVYSTCGTMIGGLFGGPTIVVYNVLSGACSSSHSIQQPIIWTIWTHGDYLQYATEEPGVVAMWQVSFSSDHAPTKVSSLSTPDNFSSATPDNFSPEKLVLLPTHSLLAFLLDKKVLVWDAQNQEVLLDSADINGLEAMVFSFDGHFFGCGTRGREFHIWKGSPTGYISHQKIVSAANRARPQISPNGGSVITLSGTTLQLWHTTSSPTSFPSVSMPNSQGNGWFFVEISSDESLVAVTERLSSTVTVLDIKTGNPWLIIDTDAETIGLRITEDKIVVVCEGKIVTWDLPARSCVFNTERKNIKDSVQTTSFVFSGHIEWAHTAISPDLNYIVLGDGLGTLYVYNKHTGQKLADASTGGSIPGFSPSGNKVWCAAVEGGVDLWEIIKQNGSTAIQLKTLGSDIKPLSGFPRNSPYGHQVTDDGWVLSSSKKQLLWLPHHWRPDMKVQRKWSGKFLAVWNRDSPGPYILELEE
jgi:hypothetical protein